MPEDYIVARQKARYKRLIMKRFLMATVLAIGLTTAGGYGYAPHGMGGGSAHDDHNMGQKMMHDNKENEARYYHPGAAGFGRNRWTGEQKQKFLADTVELRKQMYGKRFKYKEALRNPKNTRQQLLKMEKEIIDLRDKIYDQAPQNQ